MVNMFGQWTGNAFTGLLLGAVLDTAGITNEIAQTNLNLGLFCLQLVIATIGSSLVDRFGRRALLILTNVSLSMVWVCMTIATSQHERTSSACSARVIVAFIILFDIIFALGITPLQVLYTVEVMAFETRAKGVAFGSLAVNVASIVNQFAWPVALAKIGWMTYVVLTAWCLFQATLIYLFIPETRNRTVSVLFHACFTCCAYAVTQIA